MKQFFIILFFAVLCGIEAYAQSNSTDIKIFPNPATNVINVLGLKNAPSALISITDMYGNQVISHEWVIKHNALNIPILNLEKGVYLITIQSKQQTVQRKFYKQ